MKTDDSWTDSVGHDIAESATDGIARFDRQFRHLYVNPAVEYVTKIPRDRFIGRTNRELGLPDALCELWENAITRVFEGRLEEINYDYEFPAPAGFCYYQARLFPERDPDGTIASVVCICRDVTQLRRNESALRESEQRWRELVDCVPHLIWSAGAGGQNIEFNQRWHEYTGQSRDLQSSQGWARALHPDDLGPMVERWHTSLATTQEFQMELRIRRVSDEVYRWHLARARPRRDEFGKITRWIGTFTDIDDLRRPQLLEHDEREILELIATRQPLETILRALAAAIERQLPAHLAATMVLDEGSVALHGPDLPFALQAALRSHPVLSAAHLAAQSTASIDPLIVSDIATSADAEIFKAALDHGLKTSWSVPLTSAEGTPVGLFVLYSRESGVPSPAARKILDVGVRLANIAVEHDQTARRLAHFVRHDSLTGLPNRILFETRFEQALALARRNDRHLALMVIDIDHFKAINDTLGHEAGDHLLQQFAHRTESKLRESDTLARVGGDEFLALLPEISAPDDVARAASRIIDAMSAPFTVAGQQRLITASIGIAIFPKNGDEIDQLQRAADAAMYETKRKGRNGWTVAS